MTPDRLPYFPFYPQDFLGDGKVRLMSPAEVGIYVRLLCHEWLEGPLPDDLPRLARIAGATVDEMEAAWPQVRECFESGDDGHLVQPRLEEERKKALAKREQARQAARARWDDASGDADAPADGDAEADADAMRTHSDRNADGGAGGGATGDANQNQSQSTETEKEVHSLRSFTSPSPRGGAEEHLEGDGASESAGWGLGELPDGDGFPSRFFVDGVRERLWLGDEPPAGAPDGWQVRAALPDLRRAWENLGTERLVRVVRGFRLLAEAGDLPGVEPGEAFTFALLKRLRGEGLWEDAERAFQERHEPAEDGGLLDKLARGVVEREAADG